MQYLNTKTFIHEKLFNKNEIKVALFKYIKEPTKPILVDDS